MDFSSEKSALPFPRPKVGIVHPRMKHPAQRAPIVAQVGTVSTSFDTASGLTGLSISLRRRRAAAGASRRSPVLFVHGATFPSALAADFPFGGRSCMEALAERGHDVWAVDFLGYGKSDRYPLMAQAEADGAPLGAAEDAAVQIGSAVRLIAEVTCVTQVALVAHSWGNIPAGIFASRNPHAVGRFVMYAPVVTRAAATAQHPCAQGFWHVSAEFQRRRFAGLVPADLGPLVDPADLEPWLESYLASDPTSRQRDPPSVRVPYGPSADIERLWSGIELYDPAQIRVPTLIVFGEWDVTTTTEDALRLFRGLINAPERQLTILDRGTHVMHLECGRSRLYEAVASFLEKKAP
jgi:pimeloyl-ACP methyl ester carboxylesterase